MTAAYIVFIKEKTTDAAELDHYRARSARVSKDTRSSSVPPTAGRKCWRARLPKARCC